MEAFSDALYSASSLYYGFKVEILDLVPLPKDAIHIYLGVGVLLAVALVTKRQLSNFRCLLPGAFLSLLMEVFDLLRDASTGSALDWSASVHDLINTNLLPVVIVFAAAKLGRSNEE